MPAPENRGGIVDGRSRNYRRGFRGFFPPNPPCRNNYRVAEENGLAATQGGGMEIHLTGDRLRGYFRRYQLALRMMSHGARSQTVCEWSGLTRDQLVTQRRRWGFDPDERRRGPAPSAFHIFFKSKRHRSEATVFASICRILGATT